MALLVCYSRMSSEDDLKLKAAYLSQGFYEFIFHKCSAVKFPNLSAIGALGYGGDIEIQVSELQSLMSELQMLNKPKQSSCGDIESFKTAIAEAIRKGCGLKIVGDMHPVLLR